MTEVMWCGWTIGAAVGWRYGLQDSMRARTLLVHLLIAVAASCVVALAVEGGQVAAAVGATSGAEGFGLGIVGATFFVLTPRIFRRLIVDGRAERRDPPAGGEQ